MRIILLGICILISTLAVAQRECTSADYLHQQKLSQPALTARINDIENFIAQRTAQGRGNEGSVQLPLQVRIPVVVHVLYNNATENISDAQVKSQIDALNRDFRRQNSDSVNTPARFRAFAADAGIEFVLATVDPSGRATTGIVRRHTGNASWKQDDKIKFTSEGGDNAWDSRSYLNIWVGNFSSLLGYASVPGSAPEKDGVVIATRAFGTLNISGAYNMGRTTVHEVGHWLGLKHIWGDYYCGDDGVDDTPKQGNFTPGCPSTFRTSCSNGALGDMYMNYMDYTGDACMNLFTHGQKERMRSLFTAGGPRASLLLSKGLGAPWVTAPPPVEAAPPAPAPAATAIRFFPNPATTELSLQVDPSWIGKVLSITDMNGVTVAFVTLTSGNQKLSIAHLKPGMYLLQGETEGNRMREKFVKL